MNFLRKYLRCMWNRVKSCPQKNKQWTVGSMSKISGISPADPSIIQSSCNKTKRCKGIKKLTQLGHDIVKNSHDLVNIYIFKRLFHI